MSRYASNLVVILSGCDRTGMMNDVESMVPRDDLGFSRSLWAVDYPYHGSIPAVSIVDVDCLVRVRIAVSHCA